MDGRVKVTDVIGTVNESTVLQIRASVTTGLVNHKASTDDKGAGSGVVSMTPTSRPCRNRGGWRTKKAF